MDKRFKWITVAVLFAAVIGGVGLIGQREESANVAIAPQQGYRMPAFSLTQYPDNKTISTNELAGNPVFINFWTSWCTYCKLETPDIVQAYKQYGKKVVFLSVNVTSQDNITDMKQFIKQYGITWPVALDKNGSTANTYRIIGYPTSFFVDRKGIIEHLTVGALSKSNLNAELERISK